MLSGQETPSFEEQNLLGHPIGRGMHPTGALVKRPRWRSGRCPCGHGGIAAAMAAGANAPPILFLFLTKRERAVHGPREKIATAGRSAQARTLLRRREKVGFTSHWYGKNERPLGNPLARGRPGYCLLLFSLALPWHSTGTWQRADKGIRPYGLGPGRFAAGPGFTVRFPLWTKALSTFLSPGPWLPESEASRAAPRVPGQRQRG